MSKRRCVDCDKPIAPASTRCIPCNAKHRIKPAQQRFWSKVNKNGPIMPGMTTACWVWKGVKSSGGYGCIRVLDKMLIAHRVSWEIANKTPIPNLDCLHRCDNRTCVNPDHLFLGTHQDNMDDKVDKGRSYHPHGEKNPKVKLTKKQVEEIRYLYKHTNITQKELGERYRVWQSTIGHIVRNLSWQEKSPMPE